MKDVFKYKLPALFFALLTASLIGAVSSPIPGHFSKNLGFYFGSILIYGFPVYVACMVLHYWICKKMNITSRVPSTAIGLIVSLVAWLLVMVLQYEPDGHVFSLSSMIAYAAAGIVYGFISAPFRVNTKAA